MASLERHFNDFTETLTAFMLFDTNLFDGTLPSELDLVTALTYVIGFFHRDSFVRVLLIELYLTGICMVGT